MSLLIYCLFAQSLRYAEKIILGISIICLWLFSQHASTLNGNLSKSTDSYIISGAIWIVISLPHIVGYGQGAIRLQKFQYPRWQRG